MSFNAARIGCEGGVLDRKWLRNGVGVMNFGSDDVGFGRVERVGTRGERMVFVALERGKRMLSVIFLEVGMANVDFL